MWFVNDCCGIIFASATYVLVVFAEVAVVVTILLPSPTFGTTIQFFIFNAFVVLAVTAHTRTMLTDPGTVPLGLGTVDGELDAGLDGVRHCERCKSIKPARAHHCSTCRRCIRKMDHHCPWVNNCVGEDNLKFFSLFNLYIFFLSAFTLGMLVYRFLHCDMVTQKGCIPVVSEVFHFLLSLLLLLESILFTLFCLIMLLTMLHGIVTDETGIDRLKGEHSSTRRTLKATYYNFREAFGGPISIHWLSPFSSVVRKHAAHLV